MKLTIGTYTKQDSQGIYQIDLNTTSKQLENYKLVLEIDSPTYLAKQDEWMVAVVKAGTQGGVALIKDGQIVDQAFSEGAPPCYVSFDGDRVYSANYHKGRIEAFHYRQGKLEFLDAIQYGEGAKGHYVQVDPQTHLIYVCDLGSDRIGAYRFSDKFEEVAHVDIPKGSGPRHLAFHPTEALLYCFTELSNEVLVIDNTTHTILQTQSTLANPEDKKSGAAIRISADGRFVYVSNRGTNTITSFKVIDKTLERLEEVSTYGDHPRDFNLVGDDQFLVVANMTTNDLVLFERDKEKGTLTLLQKDVVAYEPVCIIE